MKHFIPQSIIIAFIGISIFLLSGVSWSQVNTEALRTSRLTPGLHISANLDLSLVSGNSELMLIATGVRLDYVEETTNTFLAGNLKRGRNGDDADLFINNGFVHLRRTHSVGRNLSLEGFLQKEFNDFIRLNDRSLAGSGVRYNCLRSEVDSSWLSTLIIGIGLMWEREWLTGTADNLDERIRSTNYVVFRIEADERLSLQLTGYYQPDISRPSDYRVTVDGSLGIKLVGNLSMSVRLSSRYDSEPPQNVKNYDLELTNGLSYLF